MNAQTVIVTVLDWGLGHATRSMPVIRGLLTLDFRVVLASNGKAGVLLRREFPELRYYDLPDYDVRYDGGVLLGILRSLPHVLRTIRRERRALEAIVLAERPVLIVSDNRYGCHHKEVRSVIICHQSHARLPIIRWIAGVFHRYLLGRFDEVWIPDRPDRLFSGELSETFGLPHRFIGVLSRFRPVDGEVFTKRWYITAVASGPEPARSRFVDRLKSVLLTAGRPCLLITGDPGQSEQQVGDVTIFGHLDTDRFRESLLSAEVVVCRSGYSSIMDCSVLGITPVLVATPGQTEQEYLAVRAAAQLTAVVRQEAAIRLDGVEMELAGLHVSEGSDTHLLETALRSVLPGKRAH